MAKEICQVCEKKDCVRYQEVEIDTDRKLAYQCLTIKFGPLEEKMCPLCVHFQHMELYESKHTYDQKREVKEV